VNESRSQSSGWEWAARVARLPRLSAAVGLTLLIAAAGGCFGGNPSQANIQLRKDNQQLSDQINQLKLQHAADQASIRALQAGATTVPSLPESRIDELFTTAGLRLGKTTGGFRPDPNKYGDTMVKVYVTPIDQEGDPLKAAGSFKIELFDLALNDHNRIGQWDFDLETAKADWYSALFLYDYVLNCPWQTVPAHANLLLRVTFTDALTQRTFTTDKEITIQPPTAQ
jgi:hypothetical protein